MDDTFNWVRDRVEVVLTCAPVPVGVDDWQNYLEAGFAVDAKVPDSWVLDSNTEPYRLLTHHATSPEVCLIL